MATGDYLSVLSHGLITTGGGAVCDYPGEDDVRDGVLYDSGGMVGNLTLPDEDDVLLGIEYGANGTEYTGTLNCGPIPPDPVAVGASPFAAIASAIRTKIAAGLSIANPFIHLVANDNYTVTETEPLFVYVRIYGPSQPHDRALSYEGSGAGRLNRPVARRVRCYIYTRTGEDVYGSDDIALMGNDPSQTVSTPPVLPGQFIAEEMVFNILDDWLPVDSNGDPLTLGPMHVMDSSDGPPVRKEENEEGLVRSHLDFEIVYILSIVPADPPG